MADRLGVKAVAALPVLAYDQVRDQLQTGDIVFCSGTYFFSKSIQWFTKSVWSHVGIIYRDDHLGRIFVLESETAIGVRLVPLSKYLRDYHGRNKPYQGRIVIGRIAPAADDEKVKKAISFGMDELTRPYDNWEICASQCAFFSGAAARSGTASTSARNWSMRPFARRRSPSSSTAARSARTTSGRMHGS